MSLDLPATNTCQACSQIESLHGILNHKSIMPRLAYRRNFAAYNLICYVNNMIGLYLSENYEVIPIFISRAHAHMKEFSAAVEAQPYYRLIGFYLRQMVHALRCASLVPERELETFLPEELLYAVAGGLPEEFKRLVERPSNESF